MRRVVIVGAGLAGLRTAEALRRGGFGGAIGLIGNEGHPYDRPPLSKDVLLGRIDPESTALRSPDKLEELDLELRLAEPAVCVDLDSRTVVLEQGDAVPYDALVLATGCAARRITEFDGVPGVTALRTVDDARQIRAGLETAGRVVVLGGGFIGGEVASAARARGVEVTIVEQEQLPMGRLLGDRVAEVVAGRHRASGTSLRLGTSVASVEPRPDGTLELQLTDGSHLDADLLVVGIGAVPNTAWLEGSGLTLDSGVVCDASLQAAPGVFAIGDIAVWPNGLFGQTMRVEHWTNAGEQARHVARNLLEETDAPFHGSNYFWSDQYGRRIQFAGIATGEPTVLLEGSDEDPFLAWYRDGERVVGAFAIDAPRPFAAGRRSIEASALWSDALVAFETGESRGAARS